MPRRRRSGDFEPIVRAFRDIGRERPGLMLRHACRALTKASLLASFTTRTMEGIRYTLAQAGVSGLREVTTEADHRIWFRDRLDAVATVISQHHAEDRWIMPGHKWGFGARAVTLFERECLLHTRLFPDRIVRRLLPLVFTPLDSRLLYLLNFLGFAVPPRLRDIDTERRFNGIQDLLGRAALATGVPRVLFEHKWLEQHVSTYSGVPLSP